MSLSNRDELERERKTYWEEEGVRPYSDLSISGLRLEIRKKKKKKERLGGLTEIHVQGTSVAS